MSQSFQDEKRLMGLPDRQKHWFCSNSKGRSASNIPPSMNISMDAASSIKQRITNSFLRVVASPFCKVSHLHTCEAMVCKSDVEPDSSSSRQMFGIVTIMSSSSSGKNNDSFGPAMTCRMNTLSDSPESLWVLWSSTGLERSCAWSTSCSESPASSTILLRTAADDNP
jgi:hypothetical protein